MPMCYEMLPSNKIYRTGGLGVAGELGGTLFDTYIYNNIIASSKGSGMVFQSTGNGKFVNIYVVNNTFYNRGTQTKFSIWYNLPAAHVVSHNLFYDFKASANGSLSYTSSNLTANDLQVDPQFNNVGIDDFSLLPTSPAINKGMPITLPNSTTLLFTTDYNGNPKGTAWDMGAYEYTPRVGVNDVKEANLLKTYPNPAHNDLFLADIEPDTVVELFDVLGRKMFGQKANERPLKIDVSSLDKGVYFIKMVDKNSVLQMGKFVKE